MPAVMCRELLQTREHAGGRRAGRGEIRVANSLVEITASLFAVTFFLNFFKNSEEPPEQIAGLGVFWVEHGGNGELMISDKNSFGCRSAQVINRALHLDTTDY